MLLETTLLQVCCGAHSRSPLNLHLCTERKASLLSALPTDLRQATSLITWQKQDLLGGPQGGGGESKSNRPKVHKEGRYQFDSGLIWSQGLGCFHLLLHCALRFLSMLYAQVCYCLIQAERTWWEEYRLHALLSPGSWVCRSESGSRGHDTSEHLGCLGG